MKHLLCLVLILLAFSACTDLDERKEENLTTQYANFLSDNLVDFVKLEGDTTQVAGFIDINIPVSEVRLKWNVLASFNLDTTQTVLRLTNGKGRLPIKWDKQLENGLFAPKDKMFCGGLQVEAGEYKKYVQLIWADEVDSVEINKISEVLTRSEVALPKAISLTITPLTNTLKSIDSDGNLVDTAGVTKVVVEGGRCQVNRSELSLQGQDVHGLDLTIMPPTFPVGKNDLVFKWKDTYRPSTDYTGFIKLQVPGTGAKYALIQYFAQKADDFEFISSMPEDNGRLPAEGAMVIVTAKTSNLWSIESDQASPSEVLSPDGTVGEQNLVIRISNNTGIEDRDVYVKVKSQGNQERILSFKQAGSGGTLTYLSSEPAVADSLAYKGETVKIKVKTSRDWWIKYELNEVTKLKKDSIGEIQIPANPGLEPRDVIITIGYDNVTVETLVFKQKVSKDIEYDYDELDNPIPAIGGTYTFHFKGTYIGNLQVRALSGGEILSTGATTTNKTPKISISSNTSSLHPRDITFEYRMGTDEWKPVLHNTDRQQKEGEIETAEVVPENEEIPKSGGRYSGVFGGTYTGPVIFKAISKEDSISGSGTCPGNIVLTIPELTGTADKIYAFSYSVDGGQSWTELTKKTQTVGTIQFGSVTPDKDIPAEGEKYFCSASGTYKDAVIFRASVGGVELVRQVSKLPKNFELLIPANMGAEREVVFEYCKESEASSPSAIWTLVETRTQARNINVKPGGEIGVGGLEEGEGSNTDVEL